MFLRIAGIAHPDPLGRSTLKLWISDLVKLDPNKPSFVAVEWDQSIFAKVRDQRKRLANLARQEWPDAPGDFISTLSNAMGFGADSHTDLLPNVHRLWLDEGREIDDITKITRFAEDRMNNYRTMLNPEIGTYGDKQLKWMSSVAWASVDCNRPPSQRDQTFANRIIEYASRSDFNWGLIVVGVCHIRSGFGFMRDLLEEFGFDCYSTELKSSDEKDQAI